MTGLVAIGGIAAAMLLPSIADARRRADGPKLVAKMNGKKFKGNYAPTVHAVYSPFSELLVIAGIHRRGPRIQTLQISCPVDLETAVLPVTPTDCQTTFRKTSHVGPTSWIGFGIDVTVTGYDGHRVAGTFAGTVQPGAFGASATTPLTVTGGTFQLDVIGSP